MKVGRQAHHHTKEIDRKQAEGGCGGGGVTSCFAVLGSCYVLYFVSLFFFLTKKKKKLKLFDVLFQRASPSCRPDNSRDRRRVSLFVLISS